MTDALLTLRRSLERGGALLMSDQHRVPRALARGGLEARSPPGRCCRGVLWKAGRTWLRVMLSHFYRARYGVDELILFEFDNLHRLNRAIPKLFTHDNYLGTGRARGAVRPTISNAPCSSGAPPGGHGGFPVPPVGTPYAAP